MKREGKIYILFRMMSLVAPLAAHMIFAICMGTLGFLAAQFIPVLGGYAVLYGLGISIPVPITVILVSLPFFAVLRGVFRFLEQHTNHYIAFSLLAHIRDLIFKGLRRLCPAKLESKNKGDLISLITSDVELLEVFYAHTISPIFIAVIVELIMCIFIGSYHWSLGVFSLVAFFTIGAIVPLVISRRSGELGIELRNRSGELASHMLESIRGLDEIQQYNAGNQRLMEIIEKTRGLSDRQADFSKLTGKNLAISNTLILLFDALMLCLCALLYTKGAIGFDGFLISLIALVSSFGPVSALAALGTTLQSTVASGGRVLAVLDEEPETHDIVGQYDVDFSGVSTEDVSFSYGGETVLNGFSLEVPENSIIGIVGKSGCGKSTMLKLIMRFWKVKAGKISLSGRNIEEINTENLRNMESYMTQETQLFKDSIEGNIRIGKLNASREEVEEACKKAAVHDFIMSLPRGYDTQIGELGSTLSGGERQRIGLARAFLHDAPFILLDEPTSNLDSLNEATVLKALQTSRKDKTVLLISHRPSTMRIADKIYSMERGKAI